MSDPTGENFNVHADPTGRGFDVHRAAKRLLDLIEEGQHISLSDYDQEGHDALTELKESLK